MNGAKNLTDDYRNYTGSTLKNASCCIICLVSTFILYELYFRVKFVGSLIHYTSHNILRGIVTSLLTNFFLPSFSSPFVLLAPPTKCSPEGKMVANADDCHKFDTCVHGKWVTQSCSAGLIWDEKINNCNRGQCPEPTTTIGTQRT